MNKQPWFIPGRPTPPHGPLARYRPTQPAGAAGDYVRAFTQPGDLVIDLFCQGPTVMRETVAAGRRALGLSVNPLLLIAARLGLSQRAPDALNAAFTHLADSPKEDVPLRRHLASLYRSACPTCGEPGSTEWFAWDRDGNYPFKKAVRCARCEGLQNGAPDDQDLRLVQRTQSRGLAYYYALDRVAPPDHPARERAAELVELYTPRNLATLIDLSRRLEALEADEETKTALSAILLDCCDAGSKLDPYGEERPRPRTLRPPSLYLERNVWLLFEEGLTRLLASETQPPVQRAEDVAALTWDKAAGYTLVSHTARDAQQIIRPGSAALIFNDPPRPDGVFWALSALWAGWLWDSPAARAMRPFLRRRRFDWDWHWRVLQAALKAAGPLLAPQGRLVTIFSSPDDALLESACLATSSAGYVLEGWGHSPDVGHRMVWRWKPQETWGKMQVERELMTATKDAVVSALRERGEPTCWPLLHTSAYAGLAQSGLLVSAAAIPREEAPALTFTADTVRRAIQSAPLEQAAGEAWWLTDPSRVEPPLADRVDEMVWELLIQQVWGLEELINAVYAHFPGPLTPDLKLVLACIDSYSAPSEWPFQKVNGAPSEWPFQKVNGAPSEWPFQKVNGAPSEWPFQKANGAPEGKVLQLRPEDDPLRRAAEIKTLKNDLTALGKRLGFEAQQQPGWDVRWLEEEREMYVFAISTQAALGRCLLTQRAADKDAQRCLVVPGGRAGLIDLKLQRDPRLAHAVEASGWQFIKFRHLRRLVAKEELDRHALKTVLGLDPIAEQEAAQIPLF